MSLDVSLTVKEPVIKTGTGIFIREQGQTRELQIEELKDKFPDAEYMIQQYTTEEVYSANITHNLNTMADKAGIYEALWRPEEIGKTKANELIELLEKGLADLKARPEYFETFNASNGWGLYKHFVPFVEKYLEACKEYPNAEISVSR
jgi:hypothetical protein